MKYLKVFSLGRDKAAQEALARLQTLTENEEKMVGALILSQASKTGKVVTNIDEKLEKLSNSLAGKGPSTSRVLGGFRAVSSSCTPPANVDRL